MRSNGDEKVLLVHNKLNYLTTSEKYICVGIFKKNGIMKDIVSSKSRHSGITMWQRHEVVPEMILN